MRYEWLMRGLQASLLAALGAGCETEERIRRTVDDQGPDMFGGMLDLGPQADGGKADEGVRPESRCMNPREVIRDGEPTGWVRCDDGALNRVAAGRCDPIARGAQCPEGGGGECATDADCNAGPHGRCVEMFLGGKQAANCGCAYGCETDADCGDERICLCDVAEGAQCVHATCATNADCGSGECGLSSFDDGCGISYRVACRTPEDACRTNTECPEANWEACAPHYQSGQWQCESQGVCGRPLLVDGAPRLAPPAGRNDWAEPLSPRDVPAEARQALVDFWSRIAALEHASVASFSKFSLQLMAMGAPPQLLADTQQAAADEVVHARLAYGLASAYAQRPVGPGPLPLGDLNIETDPLSVVAALVEEACVGETLGAAEAAAAAASCADPVVAAVWRQIARDELVHAQLGWRTLKWLLAEHPEARPAAAAAFTQAEAAWSARARAARPGMGLPGVPSRSDRAAVHLETLATVIESARAAC